MTSIRIDSQRLQDISRQDSLKWQPMEVPRYITLQQFCETTATGESTARQWIAEGRLRAVSANGHNLRIEVSEIARLFQPVPARPSDRPKMKGSRGNLDAKAKKEGTQG